MFKTTLPKQLAGPKTFEFEYQNLFDTIKVQIRIPDVEANECELSGEWGPHYKVLLNRSQMIRIGYKSPKQHDYSSYMLFPSYLQIESPILHADRMKTPFVYVINDDVNNLRFEIFLDSKGCIIKAKTTILGGFDKLRMKAPKLGVV